MYGFGDFQPPGYFSFACASDTDGAMMTSSPTFQFTGVATLCAAVSSSISPSQAWWSSTGSTESPMILQSRFSNSPCSPAR